jgi:type I restriction enzyme R subunit
MTDTTERGFESLIINYLVTKNGFEQGLSTDYNCEYAIDESRLLRFLHSTQPVELAKLGIEHGQGRLKFLTRLRDEISKRGVIEVLRTGLDIYPVSLTLFYQTPSSKNLRAQEDYLKNIFSVTRQLRYSVTSPHLALDLCIFINGIPLITCELKNQLTGLRVLDAVYQYQSDRDPRELLFQFKRCMVHFAVDESHVKFCTRLSGKSSWFLPFDRGYNDGSGNPPNPAGIMTDYLWKDILTKSELSNIIENYAQVIKRTDPETGRKSEDQLFPRYHQLSVVKSLLTDVTDRGIGYRYLIQHSAGSGKSNSIAWLSHQLISLERAGTPIIDSVIVVTDRINLDKQIKSTIKQFMQVSSTVAWAENSGDLRRFITEGKKIIISTVQKFPYILDDIGRAHRDNRFAIIIDEAHSSQSGSMSAAMNTVLGGEYDPNEDTEDKILRLMEGRRMLKNASYFAFTATPKNKTLEMFGNPVPQPDGTVKHVPFHNYSMKQAIEEKFILDVLKYYTPVKSFYKLEKTTTDDPQYDKKKAQKKLRRYVEGDVFAISEKAEIMVNHFHKEVASKIGGKARAMVVTGGIELAIKYYYAICEHLKSRKSRYKAIIAFSGEKEYGGMLVNESSINDFPSGAIEKKFKEDPYRILVVADKFQTGYDEPLLHTMYVDKMLSDIKAVQTLSRLNRSMPLKEDTCVLDFANEVETIKEAFDRYYRTTILSEETDPNKLYDLIGAMENHQVYSQEQINSLVDLFTGGAGRNQLDPIIDFSVALFKELDQPSQVEFKSAARNFRRMYGFLGAILPYGNTEWEKLDIFLTLLIPKLPLIGSDDLSAGILENIDLDSYRVQVCSRLAIQLEDSDTEISPVPGESVTGTSDPELDKLTNILSDFNDLFGNIDWKDIDNVRRQIAEIPAMVSRDKKYQNAMRNSDRQNARMESNSVLQRTINSIMQDNMELFKQFNDNPSFKEWMSSMVFNATYQAAKNKATT